jgi:hypothetical protein
MWMQQGLQACVWRGRVWESLGKCYLTTCRAVILPRFGGPEVRYINPFAIPHSFQIQADGGSHVEWWFWSQKVLIVALPDYYWLLDIGLGSAWRCGSARVGSIRSLGTHTCNRSQSSWSTGKHAFGVFWFFCDSILAVVCLYLWDCILFMMRMQRSSEWSVLLVLSSWKHRSLCASVFVQMVTSLTSHAIDKLSSRYCSCSCYTDQ